MSIKRINNKQLKENDLIVIKQNLKGSNVSKEITVREFLKRIEDNSIEHYTYEQTFPTEVWTINHKLNKEPSVIIVDNTGTIVYANVIIVDLTTIQIEFSKPFKGKAHLN